MGHYYTQQAEPRHFVKMKTRPGELRPTRVTDAKKELWLPSVTTVMNVLAKPALITWKVDQHLQQAYALAMDYMERGSKPDIDTFIRQAKSWTEEQMSMAPDAGTAFHNKLEQYFLGNLSRSDELYNFCEGVFAVIYDKTGESHWAPELRFAHHSGFAGMVDLSSDFWVIDFKTKQTADKFKPGKMVYPDHNRQLAAYREGLAEHGHVAEGAKCANVFICLETGDVDFHEHKESDLLRGWATFQDALNIWKRENYDPSFNQEETP